MLRRHVSSGPIADRPTSTSAIGAMIPLKKGGPTLSSVPVSASEISGKNVPQKITTQIRISTRLLSRKNTSRDSSASTRASERRSLRRLTTSATDATARTR